ncbi:ABC transporter permease subunit [Bradyrhizobium sp.]|jgi:ABC-type branched-subunit amino acid transport system ATPase component/ABC-type branched-subunit amino acid transport system permease subunit|uniref:ABC transporter permease subunit n=1 Tax=Bradyrhizobium sp. TaxID=376 RepID=UPI003BAF295B
MSFRRSIVSIAAFAVIYAAISLTITNSYYQLIMTLVLVWAVFGLSWNLLSGYTGLISFGHAAFFGIGAYTTALGQIYFDLSPWLLIPIAAMLGGLSGLLIGFPTFRLQGHYFALAMLAYPLAILYVFEWLGFQEITLPIKRDNPIAYMQFADPRAYTLLALAMLVGAILLTRAVERGRFGMALMAIKQNQAAAEAAGINTLVWKLRAISLSGAVAGAIGAFYAVVLLVVTPQSVFGMLVSAQALTVAMFGGVGTVWGPVIGSVILIPLAEILNAEAGSRFPGIQGVIFGLAIIGVILVAPDGLFWKVRDTLRRRKAPQPSAEAISGPATATVTHLPILTRRDQPSGQVDVVLEVSNLSRSFGGLKAVQNVSFQLHRNEILGIIGPNGAGKTTLFNLLNGFLRPDSGEILVEGRDMFARKPHELCEAGVARTFQIMRPFPRMSIADNVVVGAYVRAKTDTEARSLAADAISRVSLSPIADRIAGELSTKELRLMELARALAGQPRILLLDETLAGLGHDETDEVVAVIQRLARDNMSIAIIEHTMQAMVRLVDNFLVLDHGAVLVEGKPDAVTRDTRVIEAYLGKKWMAHAAH